jgi:hypothetical protein
MRSDFTVDWASPASDPYDTPGGKNVAYTIKLKEDGQNRNVMLAQKPETPAPFTGQTLFGEIISKDKRNGQGSYWKFQKAQREGGGGQRQNNSSKGKDEAYKADPAKQRAEAMRSAIHAAVTAVPNGIDVEHPRGLDPLITHFYGLIVGAMLDDSDEKVAESDRRLDQLAQGSQL